MEKKKMYASSGVGGVSVFTTAGSAAMSTAKNANNKARLASKLRKNKAVGSRVQSPDMQEKTMMMGKQPVKVYPAMRGTNKRGGM